MKHKITSIAVCALVVSSLGLTAFATNPTNKETPVRYTGIGTQTYEVSVPVLLQPNESGEVRLYGTWDSTKKINVTTDDIIVMTNSIDSKTKTLDVTFNNISQIGDNTTPIEVIEPISVGEITNALFGTWNGTIVYNVSVSDSHIHTWDTDYTIDLQPTCTTEGSKSIHCSTCDEVKEVTVVPVEHSWNTTYTTDKTATCTVNGSKSIHCSKCTATKDVTVITALGHNYVGSTCSRCSNKLVAGLYDKDNKLLCTWAASGINVQIEHTQNSSTAANSPYVALRKNYPTTTKVILPSGITKIGKFAFSGCGNLAYIEIPSTVRSIGYRAFANCGTFEANFATTTGWYVGTSEGAKTTAISLSTSNWASNASLLNDADKHVNKWWTR